MRARTRALLRRLAELPAVVVDHVLGPERPAELDPAGAEPAEEATVVIKHHVRVGPFMRQFGGADPDPDDDGGATYH